jgi:hypothetical protein
MALEAKLDSAAYMLSDYGIPYRKEYGRESERSFLKKMPVFPSASAFRNLLLQSRVPHF